MLRFLCVLLTFAFLPLSANAISTASIVITSCSGDLTTSLLDNASFACSGNFTLDGGFVTSDSLINISADGELFLDNLTFTAPNITFSALSGMAIGKGVVFNSGSITLVSSGGAVNVLGTVNVPAVGNIVLNQDPYFVINPGGNINLGSGAPITVTTPVLTAVPEPSTYAMMLFGIFSLASISRKST